MLTPDLVQGGLQGLADRARMQEQSDGLTDGIKPFYIKSPFSGKWNIWFGFDVSTAPHAGAPDRRHLLMYYPWQSLS